MASSRRSARPAAKPALKGSISLQTPLGAVLSESRIRLLEAIDRVGDELVIKGKSFGTMPMQARLDATSARAGLKLLGLGKLAFLATLPFRR